MRKAAMLVGMVALMSVMFASVALAVDKQCLHRPCQGTDNNDRLFERRGEGVGDTIYGRGATSYAPTPIPRIRTSCTATAGTIG